MTFTILFYEISYFALIRGAASKTELSLVDKIELAKTYQPMTGKQIKAKTGKLVFSEHRCITMDTLWQYANYLESLTCPLHPQQTNGKCFKKCFKSNDWNVIKSDQLKRIVCCAQSHVVLMLCKTILRSCGYVEQERSWKSAGLSQQSFGKCSFLDAQASLAPTPEDR